jgi:hypothetical protein
MDCFHALHFDDNHILNDQVDAVSKLNLFPIEHHRQSNLTGYCESAFSQFMSETGLIRTFQQPRSQHGVDMHRGRYNRPRELVNPNWLQAGNSRSHENGLSQNGRVAP